MNQLIISISGFGGDLVSAWLLGGSIHKKENEASGFQSTFNSGGFGYIVFVYV